MTLAGEVSSYSEKWNAERIAKQVPGVSALAIEIRVKPVATEVQSDADIARAAESILRWATNLPIDCVKVMVDDGWLTLAGEVEWGYQRDAAARAVRYLIGATGVSNDITIKPKATSNSVKADIEASLKRRAFRHAELIVVKVEGTEVILSGSVTDWAERERAQTSAWGTPGVRTVIDNLIVTGRE